jgi:hypothetical protein
MKSQTRPSEHSAPAQESLFNHSATSGRLNAVPAGVSPAGPSAWDPALTHRLRVLLHTAPLHELRLGDNRRDPELRHYDSLSLAMKVFDLVIDSAGLDREVDRNRVEQALGPLLDQMDSASGLAPDPSRHEAMVDRVLGGLRNDLDRRRPFEEVYTNFEEGLSAVRRKLEFRLLVDYFHPSGSTVLRLSNEAINLYLNALELDIEDAQAAAEAVVMSQLARGRFDEAVQTARNARWQSLRFAGKVTSIIRETRRDVSRVDWREEVPKLLEDALVHLDTRLVVERSILSTADDRLQVLDRGDKTASALVEVAQLIRDCRLRHVELHHELMGARNVFLDEQARQSFSMTPLTPRPNLLADILDPVVRLGRIKAKEVTDDVFPFFFGGQPPSLLSLADLVGWLLRPRRESPMMEVEVRGEDLTAGGIDWTRFQQSDRVRIETLLGNLEEPITLSAFLQKLRESGTSSTALELTALIALHAFAPDHESLPLKVEKLPQTLSVCGFYGDDLAMNPVEGEENGGQ